MKRLSVLSTLIFLCTLVFAASRPDNIRMIHEGGHVQGIAWDDATGHMYMSFTTCFLVVDSKGEIVGSVEKIHGHLGAMTFDSASRKVYASLECKDDEIGSHISKSLGVANYEKSTFYVAEIDVDRITGLNVPMDEVMIRHEITPANEDYAAEVSLDGKTLKHRYGCSGIDGVTVAPAFGTLKGKYLYVAYGIYSDTTRTDNDYQVLLQYKLNDIKKPLKRFFVKTGNTSYGVQNLAYDSFTGKMYMAVYKGSKASCPNYTHFAVDMSSRPVKAALEGVPYEKDRVWTLPVCGGWFYNYGSTGWCPLGDGLWYVTEPFKKKIDGRKLNGCNARLYKLTDYLR